MSKEAVYIWDATLSNAATIANVQTATLNVPLVLNSNIPYEPYFVGSSIPNNGPFIFNNVARTLCFTTAGITAGNVLVTGFGSEVDAFGNPTSPLNTPLSLTFALPNNTHSANYVGSIFGGTTYIFSKVVSVTPTALTGAGTISVGYGASGITNPYFFDDCRSAWYATCSAQLLTRTTLTYGFYCSLNKFSYPNPNQGNVVPFTGGYQTNQPLVWPGLIGTMDAGASTNQLANIPTPLTCAWFTVLLNTTANESAIFTFLQQGVR